MPSDSVRAAYLRRMLRRLADDRDRILEALEQDPGDTPMRATLKALDQRAQILNAELTELMKRLAN